MSLSVLLASSKSAKTNAIEHNLLKKIVEICSENEQALHLAELNKYTKSNANSTKSTMHKSMLSEK